MARPREVFISGPRDVYLKPTTRALKTEIVNAIRAYGYVTTAFETFAGGEGAAARIRWSPDAAIEAMRSCVGVVLLGFPVAVSRPKEGEKPEDLASEYCHYEGALAAMLNLPVLALIEEGTAERGVFGDKAGLQKLVIPKNADSKWVNSESFKDFLKGWVFNDLRQRRDLFLGYSSGSMELAKELVSHLEDGGVSVLDWDTDFVRGSNLFSEIERSARICSAAIFLFTEADAILGSEETTTSVPVSIPRDNVVFEAGFFAHAKSKPRTLIILQNGVKLPSDLKGDLHLEIDGSGPEALNESVRKEIDRWVATRVAASGTDLAEAAGPTNHRTGARKSTS